MPDREKVIKGVHDARRYLEDREWVDKSVGVHIDVLNDVLALLKEQDAVVRCKDCKHYPDGSGTKWTPCRAIIVPPCWFCADGERRTDDG